MSQKQQLAKLQQIAGLMLDSRLAALQTAARAKAESEAQLAGLAVELAAPADISAAAAERAALNYQRWADARRAELNLLLARQTVAWMEARDAARIAFGKTEALAGVASKLTARRV